MAAYQPMQNPVADLTDVFAQFARARQASKDRDEKRAEMLLRQQQSDRDQTRLDEQIRRQGAAEDRQSGLDTANAIPKIKAMLTPGDPSYDPESGMSMARAYGINLNAQQPPAPGPAPVAPERAPTEYGPRETPEIAQQAGLIRATQNVPGDADPALGAAEDKRQIDLAQAERQRFAGANETDQEFKARQSQFIDQAGAFNAASHRAPTYQGDSRIGPISFDPNAAMASREERQRLQREQVAPLAGAASEQYRPVVQAMVAAGMPGSEIAKFISEQQKDLHGDQSKAQYELTAKQKWDLGMAQAGSRERATNSNEANRNDATTNRNLTTYLGNVKEFENTAGVNKDVAMMKNIGKIHEELTSTPQSPIAQAAAIDTIAQIAQGGKASQGVMGQINAHALGPLESAYDKAYQATHNGSHSPAWVKSMTDTLSGLKRFAADEQGRVMTGFEAAAGDQSPFNGPEYSQMRDSQRRKIAAAMGMDVPPPRQPDQGAMRPGTGKRPAKSNPIIDARQPRPSLDDLAKEHGL